MVTDFRKLLDAIAERAGYKPGEIRSKMFRHTYCAARLQSLDQGAPVSVFTVAREMGHGGESMVRRVYGHLGQVRHRAEVVEYRVEAYADRLGARLRAVRQVGFDTTIGTTA
jgi:integrase